MATLTSEGDEAAAIPVLSCTTMRIAVGVALLAFAVLGCGGQPGPRGDPPVYNAPLIGDGGAGADTSTSGSGGIGFGGGCTQGTPQTVGPNDMTSLGVTANQLLAFAGGTQFATLTWGTPPPNTQVSVTPSGTTILTIEITPTPGGITYTSETAQGADSGFGGICLPGTLTIAATVHLATADGGFNETWQENLFSNDGQSLIFTQDLQKTPPMGTFRVTYTGTQHWDSTQTTLTATFDARGARGDVRYTTVMTFSLAGAEGGGIGGGGSGLFVQAASWVPLPTPDGGAEGGAMADARVDGGRLDDGGLEAAAD